MNGAGGLWMRGCEFTIALVTWVALGGSFGVQQKDKPNVSASLFCLLVAQNRLDQGHNNTQNNLLQNSEINRATYH